MKDLSYWWSLDKLPLGVCRPNFPRTLTWSLIRPHGLPPPPHRPLYPICLFSQTLPLITSVKGNERIASSLFLIKALHKGIYSTKMLSALIPKIATFDKMLELCCNFGESYSSMGLPRYYCFGLLFPGYLSRRKLDGGSNEMRYRSFFAKFSKSKSSIKQWSVKSLGKLYKFLPQDLFYLAWGAQL